MALDTGRIPGAADHRDYARSLLGRMALPLAAATSLAGRAARALGGWAASTVPVRFISGRLIRRILATNLIGLVIVIGGILYFSQYHSWLVDSKRQLLKVQGEIIAAAIAGDARVETGRLVISADDLPIAGDRNTQYRDDTFAALELSIRPERVAPILRRLMQPNSLRARVYSTDGTLILDSATLLTRGQISRASPKAEPKPEPAAGKPRTKNFWTRLKEWMIDEELPVYKEIGNANGTAYPEVRTALSGTSSTMLLLDEKGEQIVSMAVPIRRAGTVQGVLLLSTPPGEIDQILAEERTLIWTLATIALLATLVTSFLLARTVAGPMRRLSETAELASRNIGARHELPEYSERTDEVGQMAGAFAAMTAALYRRIEASESFAADVAHELKNPLTAARSTAESLAYAKTETQRRELVTQIQNELTRLNRLITDVSNASRLDAELARQTMKPVDVTRVMISVAHIFRDILVGDSRRVVTIVEPALFDDAFLVNGDAGRLGQVLTNLVDNAISFSPEGRTVTLRVRRLGAEVQLIVDDEGPGLPEDGLTIIFDRFYTDRPATEAARGKNSGLGLSISREIVVAHSGRIWAENRRAGAETAARPAGARFVVSLPPLVREPRTTTTGRAATTGRRA